MNETPQLSSSCHPFPGAKPSALKNDASRSLAAALPEGRRMETPLIMSRFYRAEIERKSTADAVRECGPPGQRARFGRAKLAAKQSVSGRIAQNLPILTRSMSVKHAEDLSKASSETSL